MSIGKRKRDEEHNDSKDEGTLRARFQQAFEAKFKPLERSTTVSQNEDLPELEDSEASSEESDWEGLSDEDRPLQVIEHEVLRSQSQDQQNLERKSFMSSRPPSSSDKVVRTSKLETSASEEDSSEAKNLKHDLDLQRLLKESHLLSPSTFNSKTPTPQGSSRLKALDLRIRDLGAKESISEQQKMPLSHRKGISAQAATREQMRRRNATENGVVLERIKSEAKPFKRREGGIGAPTVGKFKGGTLKLSSRDLRSIDGPKQKNTGGRKGRR